MGKDRVHKQLLLDLVLQKLGVFPQLALKTDTAGLTWVLDGKDKIAIVNDSRINRYRHGISRRCKRLAQRRYLGGRQVNIRPGDIVINVGANIGEVSRYFADSGARVLAFEPDPVALQCLQANTHGQSVEVLPFGLWKEDGPVTFFLATDQADSSLINPTDQSITIEATRLDAVVQQRGIGHVRLIAGDAEGAEPEVLLGAATTLETTDFVSLDCSYERRGQQTWSECAEILTSAGFRILKSKSKKHLLAERV